MNINQILVAMIFSLVLFGCNFKRDSSSDPMKAGPSHVEMRNIEGRYRLFVNDEEFFVKGAGCEFGPCYQIAAHGGNSIRTWRTDNSQQTGREVLDEAWKNGLMVMMGLDMGRERHGFDYDDTVAVAEQLERFRKEVMELKGHPALLGWGIGNELNLNYTNKNVWNAVNDIALMIKDVDGYSVVTTMLAGINAEDVRHIRERAPDLDFLSIQMYGDLINLPQRLKEAGYNGPYLVTEWGPTGHWEMPHTEWGSPIEQTSSEKAASIKERYQKAIIADHANSLGSYVFLWGQKQERTPTWYGVFTEKGERTEAITIMEYLWTGQWPEHRAPKFHDITIEGKGGRFDNVRLTKSGQYTTRISVEHPNGLPMSVRAEIMPEPRQLSVGGDYEPRPASIEGLVLSATTTEIVFRAPEKSGAYRILVYVTDENNYAATANIPFYVN